MTSAGDRPGLPGARLVIITTPRVIDRLRDLLNTGLFGRSLEEAADRVLCQRLEQLEGRFDEDGPPTVAYRCRVCGYAWFAAFDADPDPMTEHAAECPQCGTMAGEPAPEEDENDER